MPRKKQKSEQWQNRIVGDAEVDPRDLVPNPQNWRRHPDEQRAALDALLGEVGWVGRVLVNRTTGHVLDGHARREQAIKRGEPTVPVTYVELTEDEERLVLATFDPIGALADTEQGVLDGLIESLNTDNAELYNLLKSIRQDDETQWGDKDKLPGSLINTFGVPPFSVLDARQGYWQDRKRIWRTLIGDNGETREKSLSGKSSKMMGEVNFGVSLFDPVLAELIVSWWGIKGGVVVDPFAGGIFGYVASYLGMIFRGIELREEQATLNQERVEQAGLDAVYFCDDACNMDCHIPDDCADMVFTCPPYADLEHYSEDQRDLSNMSHEKFFNVYESILRNTYKKLKDNRFAVIVVGEARNKDGELIGIVQKTIAIMVSAGYTFQSELILISPVATAALRAARSMRLVRRPCRTHQNVLVFLKGNCKQAMKELGSINILLPDSDLNINVNSME